MPIGSITLTANPVTKPDGYSRTLDRSEFREYDQVLELPGWYKACRFTLVDRWGNLSEFLESGLGRQMRAYSHRTIGVFEGMVFGLKLKLERGGKSIIAYRTSFDGMANYGWARYYDTGTATSKRTTAREVTLSKTMYGQKEEVLTAGVVSATSADQGVVNMLAETGYPIPDFDVALMRTVAPSERVGLELDIRGYAETLGWRRFNQTGVTGYTAASTFIAAVIVACGQFVRAYKIDENTTQVPWVNDADRTAADLISSVVKFGDAWVHQWIWGVGWNRTFFARQAASVLTEGEPV